MRSLLNGLAAAGNAVNYGKIGGDWTSNTVYQNSVDGAYLPRRAYTARLSFGSDGTYTYIVQQSDGDAWSLILTGSYSVFFSDAIHGQIVLNPTQLSTAAPNGGELTRLHFEGLPVLVPETFNVEMSSDSLTIGRPRGERDSGISVYFRRS